MIAPDTRGLDLVDFILPFSGGSRIFGYWNPRAGIMHVKCGWHVWSQIRQFFDEGGEKLSLALPDGRAIKVAMTGISGRPDKADKCDLLWVEIALERCAL